MLERPRLARVWNDKTGPFRDAVWRQDEILYAERHVSKRNTVPPRSIDDVMNHLLHVLRMVGQPCRIGLDLDGGGGVRGMEDVAGFLRLRKGCSPPALPNAILRRSGAVMRAAVATGGGRARAAALASGTTALPCRYLAGLGA